MATIAERANVQLSQAQAAKEKSNRIVDSGSGGTKSIVASQIQNQVMAGQGFSKVDMEVNEKGQLQTNYLSTEIVNFAQSRNMQPNQVLVDLNRAETPRAYTYGANQYIPVGSTDYIKRLSVLKEQMLVAQGNAPNYEATSQQAVSYTPVQGQSTAKPIFGHGDMGAMPSEPAPVYGPIEFTRLVRKPDVNVRIENIGKANLSSWSPSAPSFPADEGPSNPAGINVSISPRVIVDTPAGTKAKAYLLPPTSDSTYTPIISFAGGNTTRTPTTGGGTRTPTTTPFVSISPKVIVDVPTGMKGETYLIPSSGNKVSPIISIVNKNPLETNFIDVSVSREVVVDVTSMVGGKTVGWGGDMARELAGKGVFVKYDNTVTSPIAKLVNTGRQPTGWGESLRGGERSGGVVRLRGLTVGMPILGTFEAGEGYRPIVSTASGRNEGTLNSPFDSRDISTGTQARMKSAWAAGKIETMRGWGELEDETTSAYSGIIKDLTASTSYFYDERYVISPSDKPAPDVMSSYQKTDPYYKLSFTKPQIVEHMTGLAGEYEMRKGQYILDVEENWYKTQSPTASMARLSTDVANSLIFMGAGGAAAKTAITGVGIVSNALGYIAMDYSMEPISKFVNPVYNKYLGEEFGGYATFGTALAGSLVAGGIVSRGFNIVGSRLIKPAPKFTGTVTGYYDIKSYQYSTGLSGNPYDEFIPTGGKISPRELNPFQIKEYKAMELFSPKEYILSKYGGIMNIGIPEAKTGVVFAARGYGFAGIGKNTVLSETTVDLYKVFEPSMSKMDMLRHPITALRNWVHSPDDRLTAFVLSKSKAQNLQLQELYNMEIDKSITYSDDLLAGASYSKSGELLFRGSTDTKMLLLSKNSNMVDVVGKQFGRYTYLDGSGMLITESQFRHINMLGSGNFKSSLLDYGKAAGGGVDDIVYRNVPYTGGLPINVDMTDDFLSAIKSSTSTGGMVITRTGKRITGTLMEHFGGEFEGFTPISKVMGRADVSSVAAKNIAAQYGNVGTSFDMPTRVNIGFGANMMKSLGGQVFKNSGVLEIATVGDITISESAMKSSAIRTAKAAQSKYGALVLGDLEKEVGVLVVKSAQARGDMFSNVVSMVGDSALKTGLVQLPTFKQDTLPSIKQEMRKFNMAIPSIAPSSRDNNLKSTLKNNVQQIIGNANYNIDNVIPKSTTRQDIQQIKDIVPDIIPDKGPIIDPNRIFGGGLFQVGGGVGPSGGGRRGKGMWGNREAIIGQLPVEQDYKNMMAALMGGVQKPVTRKKIKGGGLFWRTI